MAQTNSEESQRWSHSSFKEVKLLAEDQKCGKLRVWKITVLKGKTARRVLCCGNKFNFYMELLVTFQVNYYRCELTDKVPHRNLVKSTLKNPDNTRKLHYSTSVKYK